MSATAAKPVLYSVGAAKVDVTPDYPVRLSGYGGRQRESEGVDQRLFARALAIGTDREGVALLIRNLILLFRKRLEGCILFNPAEVDKLSG